MATPARLTSPIYWPAGRSGAWQTRALEHVQAPRVDLLDGPAARRDPPVVGARQHAVAIGVNAVFVGADNVYWRPVPVDALNPLRRRHSRSPITSRTTRWPNRGDQLAHLELTQTLGGTLGDRSDDDESPSTKRLRFPPACRLVSGRSGVRVPSSASSKRPGKERVWVNPAWVAIFRKSV
jgi:hypothetical protein